MSAILGIAVLVGALGGRLPLDHRPEACQLGSAWSCRSLEVPAVRSSTTSTDRIWIRYAVRAADSVPAGRRKLLVILDGGPGASGVEDAGWMYELLPGRVRAAYDVVAVDSRGTGDSIPASCPGASRAYGGDAPTEEDARRFVSDCITEIGPETSGAGLARFGTAENAEDVEAIRETLGFDQVAIWGSSYGTVTAQAYAVAHPDRVSALVLEAPIDRSLSATEMWVEAARGFVMARDATLAACADDEDCAADLPDPRHAWERLQGRVGAIGLRADLVGPDGTVASEHASGADVAAVGYNAMYDLTTRMQWLRALAAANQGDDRPMLRLIDEVGGATRRASFSYFATWCADTRASPTARTDDYAGFVAAIDKAALRDEGARQIALSIAPCVFWPGQPATWTAPADVAGVPMLILTATDDPITPVAEARRIAQRVRGARMVETIGGAHGTMGEDCPNEWVDQFLVDGVLPAADVRCEDWVADGYVPLSPNPAATATDAVDGLTWELFAAPEISGWDGESPLSLGCAEGGRLRLDAVQADGSAVITLESCAWVAGTELSGTGTVDLYTWDYDLALTSPRGRITVTATEDAYHLSGTWDGKAVSKGD